MVRSPYRGLKPGDTYVRILNGQPVSHVWQPAGSRARHVEAVRDLITSPSLPRYREVAERLGIAYEAVRAIVAEYDIPYTHKAGAPRKTGPR